MPGLEDCLLQHWGPKRATEWVEPVHPVLAEGLAMGGLGASQELGTC